MKDGNEIAEDEIRQQEEIALRSLALYSVWCIAIQYKNRQGSLDWITKNNLRAALSNDELAFIDADPAPKRQIINFSWQCERLLILLWCLGLVDEIPASDCQCDTSIFQDILPPLNGKTVANFMANVDLRKEEELWALAERIEQLHWKARNAKINKTPLDEPIDIEIVQEQHHAINWVMGYCALGWDDMVCDT